MNRSKFVKAVLSIIPLAAALLYGSGYVAQFIRNYKTWQANGGTMGDRTSPGIPSPAIDECMKALFSKPYGIIGIGICVVAVGFLIIMIMKMGAGERTDVDRDRNFEYSSSGTYLNSNHEVATHGYTHMAYNMAPLPVVTYEIMKDREELEGIFKRIIRGGAYPYGTYNSDSIEALKSAGIVYCRTVKSTHSYSLPQNWLELHPTCHHNDDNLFELTQHFVKTSSYFPLLLYVWGHTYEFDNDNNRDRIEKFCEIAGGKEDIWYCTNIEIYEYVKAFKSLVFSADSKTVYNPTLKKIWFKCNGEQHSIESGETLILK